MRRITVTGLDRVLTNLNRQVLKIKKRTAAGMWEAALIVQRRSMELTPVDTGNLKGSAYSILVPRLLAGGPGAEIGYTASYAPFVHEIDRNYKVGQWKFLETALKEKRKEVLEAIRRRARV
jgi:hypothetical protein